VGGSFLGTLDTELVNPEVTAECVGQGRSELTFWTHGGAEMLGSYLLSLSEK
jgi:hypothetical protein